MKMTVNRCMFLSLISISLYSLFFIYQSHHNASYYVGNLYKPFRSLSQEHSKDVSQKNFQNPTLASDSAIILHELSRAEPYRSRLLHIQKECSKKPKQMNLHIRKMSFKYDDKTELVMCETPKVASTTWQLLFLRLSGFKANFTQKLLQKWDYNIIPNKHFGGLKNEEDIRRRMANYTTFLLTRHPFERLVSAYYDKFSNRSTYQSYKKRFGVEIAKQQASDYLHGLRFSANLAYVRESKIKMSQNFQSLTFSQQEDVLKYAKIMQSGEISFFQFVKYLLDLYEKDEVDEMDIHWRPQVKICHPCLFNYSFVINFENVSLESNHLLEYVQSHKLKSPLPQKLVFQKKSEAAKSNIYITKNTFNQIPEKYVKILRKIYEDDFLVYNYDPYLYRGFEI